MRTNKNLEVKSKAWKHLFFLCALCVLCGFIGCENHWMKEATAHMHRHRFDWVTTKILEKETLQTYACTTGCNTTMGTRVLIINDDGVSPQILTPSPTISSIISGGQPDGNGKLIIPSELNGVSITGIGNTAFRHNIDIKEVVIQHGVQTIGEGAFYICSNLTKVTIPDSVTSIGAHAFRETALTEIRIPANVTSINLCAFQSCKNLASVTFAGDVTIIGQYAFSNTTALTSIRIPASVISIGLDAFRSSGLTEVIFEGASTTIADNNSFPNGASLIAVYPLDGAGTYTRTGSEWTRVP